MKLTRIDKMIHWLGLPASKAIQLFYDGKTTNDNKSYTFDYVTELVTITDSEGKQTSLYIHN